ncbi:MAG TPA: hypothetical protein VIK56_09655 [Rhodoferax sp.]
MKPLISKFATLIVVATVLSALSSTVHAGTMNVKTKDGGTIQTKDFLHNGITIPDWNNRGYWLLSGTKGYCAPNQKCIARTTAYAISYIEQTGYFGIDLLKQPIGKARREAEQFLLRILGVTPNELCRLDYQLSTNWRVDQKYAGVDLSFSFCPGATPL